MTSFLSRQHCAYYITGHGYGHATRSLEVMLQLLESVDEGRELFVHIISSLDHHFFLASLPARVHDRIIIHRRSLDAGAIQSNVLEVDMHRTLLNYYFTIHAKFDEVLQSEVLFLRENSISLVLVDATPLACAAAQAAAGCKCALISNFSWDYIYRAMLLEGGSPHSVSYSEVEDMVNACASCYLGVDLYLQLPGATPLPPGLEPERVVQGPLVSRRIFKSSSETRQSIGLSSEQQVLLLSFGGHDPSSDFALHHRMLPSGWICVVVGGVYPLQEGCEAHRFKFLPKDSYVPDLVHAADVVIGKIGYGTVSECINGQTPLVYVPRSGWPEERHVVPQLSLRGCANVALSPRDFYAGEWTSSVLQVWNEQLESSGGKRLQSSAASQDIVDILKQKFPSLI